MRLTVLMCVAVCVSLASAASAVTIETVPVGNTADSTGYGAVDYEYNIGKYEVTAGQYTEFLNAVANTDTYGLYNTGMWSNSKGCKIQRSGSSGSYTYSVASDFENRPVNYVSWGDAARFANWLHNGQTTGLQNDSTTEDGAYYLNGATTDAELVAVTREVDATWMIPSEDEWYKAAYHKNDGNTGNYWDFPTSSDSTPGRDMTEATNPGNNANYYDSDWLIGSPYYRTAVGEFDLSDSPYGTFDQGGNVWEWNEAVVGGLRGGSMGYYDYTMGASYRYTNIFGASTIGFRVSEIPEPATVVLLSLGGLMLSLRRR